ncbi:MAG: glycoside hydrolase family 3 C-terminal domain-containing protein [Verrucomicrobiota bacterium]|nr:glycoside hydrolase family 3 C-terminal domain-containing protein [Verrucomicrobiota bacterium]
MSIHSRHPHFTAPSPAVEARVNALIQQLTLDDKIRMLGGHHKEGMTLDIPRVGIPNFWMADGPVGVHWWTKESTAYPALIALAASWDEALAYKMGEALGRDCRSRGVHILLAPGVNLYRSPLCGRNFEYLGEDPILSGKLATAYIRGVQDQGVAATVKHFAANFQEYDRHGISSDADERTLREVYLKAFEMAVKDGGTAALMTAYNLINGEHCSEHDWLLQTVLKGEWGYSGLVMSDWDSTYSAVGAVANGLDLEMPWAKRMTAEQLKPALANGLITVAMLDDKVRRLLRLAVCFGWLDHPQKDETIPYRDPKTEAVALEVARRGITLLKNDSATLPYDPATTRKVVVLGHAGVQPMICGGGSAYTTPHRLVTLVEGLKQLLPEADIKHFTAVDLERPAKAFAGCMLYSPDGERGLRGEYFNNRTLAGTPALVRLDAQVDFGWYHANPIAPEVDKANFSIRWTGEIRPTKTAKHILFAKPHDAYYRVLLDDVVVMESGKIPVSRLQSATMELKAGRSYKVQIEYFKDRDWNAMRFGWEPVDAAFVDYECALHAASEADAVIVTAGFTGEIEGEGYDREFGLDLAQEALINSACSANPKTAVVLFSGSAVDVTQWLASTPALLHNWFPGQEGGLALAEVLLGKINPGGRLPFTWEKRLQDRSSFPYYHDTDGDKRVLLGDGVFGGYRHFDRAGIAPQFPFGFGLSYTTFALANLQVAKACITAGEVVLVTVDVSNTGSREGTTTVQLYVSDVDARLPRPIKELKSFTSVTLAAGEKRTITFAVTESMLNYFDPDAKQWVAEPGVFDVLVGFDAGECPLKASLTLL